MDFNLIPEELRMQILRYGAPEIGVVEQYLVEEIQQFDPTFSVAGLDRVLEEQQQELRDIQQSQEWQVYQFMKNHPYFSADFDYDRREQIRFTFADPNLTAGDVEALKQEMAVAFGILPDEIEIEEPDVFSKYYHGYYDAYANDLAYGLIDDIDKFFTPTMVRIAGPESEVDVSDIPFSLENLYLLLEEQSKELEQYRGTTEWQFLEFLDAHPEIRSSLEYSSKYPFLMLISFRPDTTDDTIRQLLRFFSSYREINRLGKYDGYVYARPAFDLDIAKRIRFLQTPIVDRIRL